MTATPHPAADAPLLCRMTAAELTSLYEGREVSPVEVARSVLDRAEAVNPKLNAFVLIDGDGAMAAARESEARWMKGVPIGPVDGVPATIKNLVSVRNWPLRMGSFATADAPVKEDAPTAQSLRKAGVVLVGATTTCEFGWKGVADSPYSGVVRNPWNPALTSGGSSGGAVVAAATGCGVMHLGSDGGGSIRIPASFTGVVGHKPSFGRVPYFPPSAFGTVGHLGPIARTVDDAALMLDVLSAKDIRDWHQNPLAFPSIRLPLGATEWKDMRIGLWTRMPGIQVDGEVLDATTKAATMLESMGARVETINLPGEDLLSIFNILWFSGAANRVRKATPEQRGRMDPGFIKAAEAGASYTAVDYADASNRRAEFGIAMDALLDRFELVISPTTPLPAFAVGHDVPPESGQKYWTEWASFNFPLNLSQQPACSVPSGTTKSGLPIGLQFVGPKTGDARVLRAAACFVRHQASHLSGKRWNRGK